MDFGRTKQLIKKIKNLNSTLAESVGKPSEIERDLMLSYVSRLYEEIKFGSSEPKPVARAVEAPVVVSVKEVAVPVAPPTPEVIVEKEKIVAEPVVVPEKVKTAIEPVIEKIKSIDPELEALFNEKEVRELSDKLRLIPIPDLTKSMGINEKIFTIKELFGGDQSEFDSTLSELNGLTSFEEAKNYLINNIASKNEWQKEIKKNKAVNFLRLVKRRYV